MHSSDTPQIKGEKEMSTNVATQNKSNTAGMSKVRFITQVGMLGAIAVILMAFEIPLPFAQAFYKIDFSEVPGTDRLLCNGTGSRSND